MSAIKDEQTTQALAAVARLSGFTLKSVATTDDLETRTITLKFTRISDGAVQPSFEFERIDQVATVDGNGHVEKVELVGRIEDEEGATTITRHTPLQPGDLAETEEEAEAERAQAELDQEPSRSGEATPVGELAAAVKHGRQR